jgi:hypothetical protein
MANISKEDLITQLVQLGIDQHSDPRQLRENVTALVEKVGILDRPEQEPVTADMITDEMQAVVLEHRNLYLSKKCFAATVNAYFSVLYSTPR